MCKMLGHNLAAHHMQLAYAKATAPYVAIPNRPRYWNGKRECDSEMYPALARNFEPGRGRHKPL